MDKKIYKSWDTDEINKLRRYVDAKVSVRKAAIDFDRSESSITNAAYRLRKADLEANRAIKEQQRMMEQMNSALRLYSEYKEHEGAIRKIIKFAGKLLRVVIRR